MRRFPRYALCVLLSFAVFAFAGIPASADLVNESGRLRYYDEKGRAAVSLGLDVSYYNNQIDWYALKAQGFDFVIIRLGGRGWGSGTLYGDRQTQSFLRGARRAGLQVGAYFYSAAVNPAEAVEEAQAALYVLNGFRLDLPLFLDMELSSNALTGRADRLSPGARADIIEAFARTVQDAGYKAGLYTSEGYSRYNLDSAAVSYLPLWMASYTVENRLPQYITDYSIWQQTDSAYAGGIEGGFDLDIILPEN